MSNILHFIRPAHLAGMGMLLLSVALAFLISALGMVAVMGAAIAVPLLAYLYALTRFPQIGLYSALAFSFFAVGLTRYVPAPLGLAIDGLLFVSVLAAMMQLRREDIGKLNTLPVYVFGIWFLYTTMQVFNPQAPGFTGWFYAIRGTSYNFFFIIILSMILMSEKKHMMRFLYLWLGLSLLAVFYGFKQKFIGLDGAEQAWLDAGNASTHVLHGRLRVFSFYSDAGQFGVAMAHAALMSIALLVGPARLYHKIIFAGLALLFFYAMAISGTRGALFVPVAGALVYFLANRNFTILALGVVVLGSAFILLRYTYIGQGNYEVQRLRSALNPEDASLNVRQENQRILARYLADKPFGGGIGTSGYFGLRFSPDSLLAQTPTDSWYVRIWAETGVVGLFIHLGGLLMLLVAGFFKVFTLHDPGIRNLMAGLLAGYAGIVVASYGNSIIGQYPTNMITMISIALIWKCAQWDKHSTIKDVT